MREPQMNWVMTPRPRWSVPSGNSAACAQAGFSVELTALSPAASASSGAARAIRTTSTRIVSPIIPGRLPRYSAPGAGHRARGGAPGDPPRRKRAAIALMPSRTRGSR